MNLQYLNWRLYAGFFSARAWLCDTCWGHLSKYAHPVQESDCFTDGKFVIEWGPVAKATVVSFSSKGGDGVSEGACCSFCNAVLPEWGEEVNLSVDL